MEFMAIPTPFQPHKLFIATLFGPDARPASIAELVESAFGRIDAVLPAQPFSFSTYYEREMGADLRRALFSVSALVDPSSLATLKDRSNRVECETSRERGGRTVNLDPGLLSLSRVMLVTTKASAHRVPLRDGLYAEITLMYRHGRYAPLEWTYPDYRSEGFVDWLGEVRARYHEQLREIDPGRAWRL